MTEQLLFKDEKPTGSFSLATIGDSSPLFPITISLFGERYRKEYSAKYPNGYNSVEIYAGPLKSTHHNDLHGIIESAHADALYSWDLKQAVRDFLYKGETSSIVKELLRLRRLAQQKPLVLICESKPAMMYAEYIIDKIIEINELAKVVIHSENAKEG